MPLIKDDPKLADFACDRRGESHIGSVHPGPDKWREENTGFHTCSYCGSLHPDEFFELADQGVKITPTDKSYKAYIDIPDPHPEALKVVTSSTHAPEDKTGWYQVTKDNCNTLPFLDAYHRREDYWGHWVKPEPRGPIAFGKFYFQHLSEEQRIKFIEYTNDGKFTLGVPGYWYSMPFFARRVPISEGNTSVN